MTALIILALIAGAIACAITENYLATTILTLFLGVCIGYTYAHFVVAEECEKNGGFFVGEKIYKCTLVDKK
ncbi:hypothetical protein [Phocoenobacter skyensis]|uniref:Uncharacterized protein n=1 Tax=Phocoenobacter skyensis TaxID=97481 RepID=A0A1H7XKG3_9PAST|nr:hypothetical protein [Pasteurella skyensis]MDP8184382.1 hypothetical protein [Pasteurella skyensis]QLB22615.1 hypothetical protein A6B44_05100 [Pasteurella skyensis]SEM34094.1 hypothetical protein SAMN05444853_11312 [Pasteurella skyensis]